MYIYIFVSIHIYTYTYKYMCAYIYTHINKYKSICKIPPGGAYTIYVYVYVYVYIHIHINTCVHIYIHIYTHMHKYIYAKEYASYRLGVHTFIRDQCRNDFQRPRPPIHLRMPHVKFVTHY